VLQPWRDFGQSNSVRPGRAAGWGCGDPGRIPVAVVFRRCRGGWPGSVPGTAAAVLACQGDRAQGGSPVRRVVCTRAGGIRDRGCVGFQGGSVRLQVPALQQHVCGHGDSTEESRQGGGGAGDGRDRPPVLRLPAQVGAHGLERSLDSPASQEPGHDRMGRALRAGTGQGTESRCMISAGIVPVCTMSVFG